MKTATTKIRRNPETVTVLRQAINDLRDKRAKLMRKKRATQYAVARTQIDGQIAGVNHAIRLLRKSM